MLVDPKFNDLINASTTDDEGNLIKWTDYIERLDCGIYSDATFNFHLLLANEIRLDNPWFGQYNGIELSHYGVCDTVDQWKELYRPLIDDPRHFCVAFALVRKCNEQPNGWRWHKWGPYIGT